MVIDQSSNLVLHALDLVFQLGYDTVWWKSFLQLEHCLVVTQRRAGYLLRVHLFPGFLHTTTYCLKYWTVWGGNPQIHQKCLKVTQNIRK